MHRTRGAMPTALPPARAPLRPDVRCVTDRPLPPAPQRMGDTGAHSKDTQAATEQELRMIGTQVANNKDKMVSMLLQSVTSVGL